MDRAWSRLDFLVTKLWVCLVVANAPFACAVPRRDLRLGLSSRPSLLGCCPFRACSFFDSEFEDDWQCGINRFDVSSCQGLQCNITYIQTDNSIAKANGRVYYECVKQISYDGIIFNAPDGYLYMPAGCEYNTAWDPAYPCFGGMEWNAFASACPTTCHYTPTEVRVVATSHGDRPTHLLLGLACSLRLCVRVGEAAASPGSTALPQTHLAVSGETTPTHARTHQYACTPTGPLLAGADGPMCMSGSGAGVGSPARVHDPRHMRRGVRHATGDIGGRVQAGQTSRTISLQLGRSVKVSLSRVPSSY